MVSGVCLNERVCVREWVSVEICATENWTKSIYSFKIAVAISAVDVVYCERIRIDD